MLTVGTVVAGRYRVEQIIGRGGMGVVAVATHVQLGQQVAIKVLHDEIAHDATFVTRFLREARASAALRSDHVCRVSDLGTLETGAPYLVMELLDGSDLARVVAQAPLPIATAAEYVLQACSALAEAHAQGLVHRDLKPGNLFLTRAGRIKVLDFGIAKSRKDELALTRTAHVLGSPRYMSPEQLRSARDVDARTDIWALGVILYELVSQRVPFPAESITELAVKVAVDPPQPLDVDPAFRAVVWRCMEKAADARYASVEALAADLARFTPHGAELLAQIQRPVLAVAAAPVVDAHAATAASTAPGGLSGRPPGADTTGQAGAAALVAAPPMALSQPRPSRRGWWFVGGSAVVLAGVIAFAATRHAATQPAIDAPRDVAVVVADAPPPPDAMPDAMPDAPIDAAAPAPVPVDPARELRAQLREANAKKDWDRAVLLGRKLSHIGQLDKESDKLSTEGSYKINDEMRPSIERLIQSGDCANARTRFDAMVKRSDLHDQPLYKKLQACGGEVTMDDVLLHANKGEYDEALAAAEQILAKDPRDERARRYAVVAACMAKNPAKAQALYDKLTDPKRKEDAKGICSARGIEVK